MVTSLGADYGPKVNIVRPYGGKERYSKYCCVTKVPVTGMGADGQTEGLHPFLFGVTKILGRIKCQ